MRKATRQESISALKTMLRLRLKKKGAVGITEEWLTETATKIHDEIPEGESVQVLEPRPQDEVKGDE